MEPPHRTYGRLLTAGGDDIPLYKRVLIMGRDEDCDIVLRFPQIARRHCQLRLEDGLWWVAPLGPKCMVKVNKVRVADWCVLHPGYRLTLGPSFQYQLFYDAPPALR
jgi:pSer/pThr/pTyr-binding forkhead associated (FHA) protein